jgi:hypothetical protein
MTLSSPLHLIGTFFSRLVPSPRGPRQQGQFSPETTPVNSIKHVANVMYMPRLIIFMPFTPIAASLHRRIAPLLQCGAAIIDLHDTPVGLRFLLSICIQPVAEGETLLFYSGCFVGRIQ